jgi:hypothetical protein
MVSIEIRKLINRAKKEDIKYPHDPGITIKEGMYFIETRDEHIIKFKHGYQSYILFR